MQGNWIVIPCSTCCCLAFLAVNLFQNGWLPKERQENWNDNNFGCSLFKCFWNISWCDEAEPENNFASRSGICVSPILAHIDTALLHCLQTAFIQSRLLTVFTLQSTIHTSYCVYFRLSYTPYTFCISVCRCWRERLCALGPWSPCAWPQPKISCWSCGTSLTKALRPSKNLNIEKYWKILIMLKTKAFSIFFYYIVSMLCVCLRNNAVLWKILHSVCILCVCKCIMCFKGDTRLHWCWCETTWVVAFALQSEGLTPQQEHVLQCLSYQLNISFLKRPKDFSEIKSLFCDMDWQMPRHTPVPRVDAFWILCRPTHRLCPNPLQLYRLASFCFAMFDPSLPWCWRPQPMRLRC